MSAYILSVQIQIDALFEKNKIRNPNKDKIYKKNCPVTDNFSVVSLIIYYCGAYIAKPGSIIKKKESAKTFSIYTINI